MGILSDHLCDAVSSGGPIGAIMTAVVIVSLLVSVSNGV
jgi:hypothetical protein